MFAAIAVTLALGATALAIGLGRQSGENGQAASSADPALVAFVDKLENLLIQSRDARSELRDLLTAAQSCELSSAQALVRLDLVERSRQSLLEQTAALTVPDNADARAAARLFHASIQRSIASDWLYGRWLRLERSCPRSAPPTGQADAAATGAKQAFLAAFNPVARQLGRRTWHPSEF